MGCGPFKKAKRDRDYEAGRGSEQVDEPSRRRLSVGPGSFSSDAIVEPPDAATSGHSKARELTASSGDRELTASSGDQVLELQIGDSDGVWPEVPLSPADFAPPVGASTTECADTSNIGENEAPLPATTKAPPRVEKDEAVEMSPKSSLLFRINCISDKRRSSFAEKAFDVEGSWNPRECGIGFTCRKGLKPESPNQDTFAIWRINDTISLYGVFDGHGPRGDEVAHFVKDKVLEVIAKDSRLGTEQMAAMLADTFEKVQGMIVKERLRISADTSGTTATIFLHDHGSGTLVSGHVADSTGVLGVREGPDLVGTAITRDHKPDLQDERARIERSGGRVIFDGYANNRVYSKGGMYPGLNMSRSFGDLLGHQCGIISEPELGEHILGPQHELLLICSDGVWEFITATEAVQLVTANSGLADPMAAAEKLAKEAWERWIDNEKGEVVDDITVVLVDLKR